MVNLTLAGGKRIIEIWNKRKLTKKELEINYAGDSHKSKICDWIQDKNYPEIQITYSLKLFVA